MLWTILVKLLERLGELQSEASDDCMIIDFVWCLLYVFVPLLLTFITLIVISSEGSLFLLTLYRNDWRWSNIPTTPSTAHLEQDQVHYTSIRNTWGTSKPYSHSKLPSKPNSHVGLQSCQALPSPTPLPSQLAVPLRVCVGIFICLGKYKYILSLMYFCFAS
jgi:hypothetical protein